MQTSEIVDILLETRKSLLMWSMDISGIDKLLEHVNYDTSTLPKTKIDIVISNYKRFGQS